MLEPPLEGPHLHVRVLNLINWDTSVQRREHWQCNGERWVALKLHLEG